MKTHSKKLYSGGGSGLHADLTDTATNGHPDSVITAKPFLVNFAISDKPSASQKINLTIPTGVTLTLPVSLTGSKVKALTAATAETTFDIQKNTVSVGSIIIAASGTTATFTFASEQTFSGTSSDYLTIVAPAQDVTLADIGFSLKGTRS